jgi:hypothetical protein
MTDWQHRPITVEAIETDPEFVQVEGDKVYDSYDLTFTAENWWRIKEGRACMRCWELQPIPFLTATGTQCKREKEHHLPGCAYSGDGIQKKQQRDIDREFRGKKWIGPKADLKDTLAEDDEKRAKFKRDTGNVAGPVVPPWVKL